MLVTEILRNKPNDPDHQVERVLTPSQAHSVARIEKNQEVSKRQNKRKGVILRNGNRRRGELPYSCVNRNSVSRDRDRRHGDTNVQSCWSPETHDVFVIAVKKDSGLGEQWSVGDEVYVEPPQGNNAPVSFEKFITKESQKLTKKTSEGSLVKEERDYIVSFSPSIRRGK